MAHMTAAASTTTTTRASDICEGDVIDVSALDHEITLDTVVKVDDRKNGAEVIITFAVAGDFTFSAWDVLEREDIDEPMQCECELDWNCGLHTAGPTAIERINDAFAFDQAEIDRQGGWF